MKKHTQSPMMLVFAVTLVCGLALGSYGCSDSSGTDTTTTSAVSTTEDTGATLEGAWYRISAVKADGTAYTEEELAENSGVIVFHGGTFTEDWPEDTYQGSYAYAGGIVTITYEDGDVQTLTLTDDGLLVYTYESEGSTWDGETSTFSRVSPIDGTWLLTSGTNADGTAFTEERMADSSFVFGKGEFSENWPGGETHEGTFVYWPKDHSIVLTYDDGKNSQTLILEDDGTTVTWQYVNEDVNDEDYQFNGEVYHYTLNAAE